MCTNVGDEESGIQCEVCKKWWHTNCVKIPDDVYKVLGEIPNLHWFCEVFNSGAHKILTNLTKLNRRVDQFETELKSNPTELEKFGERMDKVDMEIKKLCDNVQYKKSSQFSRHNEKVNGKRSLKI